MGIVKQKGNNIKISKEDKEKLITILNEQDLLFSALGYLQTEYENGKTGLMNDLKQQTDKLQLIYKSMEDKFGTGTIDIKNWIYNLQQGE